MKKINLLSLGFIFFQVLSLNAMYKKSINFLNTIQVASEQDIMNAFSISVNPNTQEDDQGYYFLHIAVSRQMPALTRMLIESGANTQVKNDNGQTPLDLIREALSQSSSINTLNQAKATLKVLLTAVSPQEKIQYTLMPLLTNRIMAARQLEVEFSDQEIQQAVIESFQANQLSDSTNPDVIWINGLMVSRKALQG